MRRLLLVLAAVSIAVTPAVAAHGPASRLPAEDAEDATWSRRFKKRAPSLQAYDRVTCVIAEERGHLSLQGVLHRRQDARAYYPVTATLHDLGGKLTWTAKSPKCWAAAKKKYLACNSSSDELRQTCDVSASRAASAA